MGANFSERVKRLRKLVKGGKMERVLVTDPNDVYYYTGYRMLGGDSCFLVIEAKGTRPGLFVCPLLNEAECMKEVDVIVIKKLRELADAINAGVTGYDEYDLRSYMLLKLKRLGVRLKAATDIIKKPREIKEAWEVEQIKKAVKITKKVFGNVTAKGIAGKKELQVAREVDTEFRVLGADNSFNTIISSGKNSYFVHRKPGERKIRRGDLVIIDLGARLNGYCSDITRTLYLGTGRKEMGLIADVRNIQKELMKRIVDGADFRGVERLYENIMKRRCYKIFHGFGHGVGLSVHEPIRNELRKGMVLTVEPGVYIKGVGGCRFEDMVLIKKKGIEVLSRSIPV
jgi:Xaa-Pro aminopeptidase